MLRNIIGPVFNTMFVFVDLFFCPLLSAGKRNLQKQLNKKQFLPQKGFILDQFELYNKYFLFHYISAGAC